MRFGWVFASVVLLSACGKSVENTAETGADTSPVDIASEADLKPVAATELEPAESIDLQALTDYSPEWSLNEYWTGEYPSGFLVYQEGVVAAGREQPVKALPLDLECPLEASANYQVWNRQRIEADDVVFFSANKTFPVTLSQDATVEYATDDGIMALDLKAGEQLTYLSYMSEGFAKFSYNGQQVELNESELRDISDIGEHEVVEDQWARVTCTNGQRVWLLYSEVIETEGVGRSPMIAYGEAHDISPEEADVFAEEIGIPIE